MVKPVKVKPIHQYPAPMHTLFIVKLLERAEFLDGEYKNPEDEDKAAHEDLKLYHPNHEKVKKIIKAYHDYISKTNSSQSNP